MKRFVKSLIAITLCLLLISGNTITVFAHSGRTDSSGGHRDNKNRSGLGSYHYHCGGYPAHLHSGGHCPYTDVFPSAVIFSIEKYTLRKGEKIAFSAEVYPSNACDTSVDISCRDTGVIRISGNTITAVGYGTATIYAESFNECVTAVTITVQEIKPAWVTVTSSVDDGTPVYIGDSIACSAAITPENVDNPSISWSSSDNNIATVDKKGNVKTFSEGFVTITATASNGVAGYKYIQVLEKRVESVALSEEKLDLLLQDKHKVTATVTPADATFPEVTWTTSDSAVVEVDEAGSIVAVGCGNATITATAKSGVTSSLEVLVTEVVAESIEISSVNNFFVNEPARVEAVFYPANTTIQDTEWTSSDPQIASIDANGNVTCNSAGKVIFTATQKDVVASKEFEVNIKPVERIEIQGSSKKENRLPVGKLMSLSASVYPLDATYPEVTWSSSDEEIATVNENGVVTAISKGNVLIVASTKDGFVQEYEMSVSHTVQSFFRNLFGKEH